MTQYPYYTVEGRRWLALPRDWGLTTPGGLLGGAHAGYRIVNTYPHPRQRYETDIPPPPPLPDGETYDFFVHYQTPGQAPEWRINDVGNEPCSASPIHASVME